MGQGKMKLILFQMHKRFCCLDPTTTRLYITSHIQFDEAHFPAVPRSLSSFHISNFLEPRLYHIDPPTPSSLHIARSRSSPCDICYDLVDEYVQIDTSLAGSSLPLSASDSPSIELAVDSSSSLGSDPTITRAKVDIFKTRYPTTFDLLGSFGLLFALLALIEPREFKSTAKSCVWIAAMDEEIRALQQMTLRFWFFARATPTFWALNGCLTLNICSMDLLSISRLVWLPKVILRFLVSITLALSVLLLKLLLSTAVVTPSTFLTQFSISTTPRLPRYKPS